MLTATHISEIDFTLGNDEYVKKKREAISDILHEKFNHQRVCLANPKIAYIRSLINNDRKIAEIIHAILINMRGSCESCVHRHECTFDEFPRPEAEKE